MLVNLTIISKNEKVSIDKLWKGINDTDWEVVKIHEIENMVLSGEKQ